MCVSVCAGVKGTFCHVLLVFGWARGSVRVYLSLDLYSLCLSLAVCRPYLCMSTHGSWFCACVSLPPLVSTPIIIYIANYFLQRTLLFTFLSLSVCTQCVNTHVHTRARKKEKKKPSHGPNWTYPSQDWEQTCIYSPATCQLSPPHVRASRHLNK